MQGKRADNATQRKRVAVAEALLDAGASLAANEEGSPTCLHLAASCWKRPGTPDLHGLAYRLCLTAGPALRDAAAGDGRTALHIAAQARSWVGLVLLHTDASCRQGQPRWLQFSVAVTAAAARLGPLAGGALCLLACCFAWSQRRLLCLPPRHLHTSPLLCCSVLDKDGCSPADVAAKHGHCELLAELLDRTADELGVEAAHRLLECAIRHVRACPAGSEGIGHRNCLQACSHMLHMRWGKDACIMRQGWPDCEHRPWWEGSLSNFGPSGLQIGRHIKPHGTAPLALRLPRWTTRVMRLAAAAWMSSKSCSAAPASDERR